MIKIFAVVLLSALTLSATAVVGTGAYLYSGGIAVCEVDTPEVKLTIPVPMRLADIGLTVARFAMPREDLRQMRREVAPFVPLVEGVLRSIADIPEGTLVAVSTAEETVFVGHRRGKMQIDVETADAVVHVRVPMRSLQRLARGVGRLLNEPHSSQTNPQLN